MTISYAEIIAGQERYNNYRREAERERRGQPDRQRQTAAAPRPVRFVFDPPNALLGQRRETGYSLGLED
jgi:hypothetical protein